MEPAGDPITATWMTVVLICEVHVFWVLRGGDWIPCCPTHQRLTRVRVTWLTPHTDLSYGWKCVAGNYTRQIILRSAIVQPTKMKTQLVKSKVTVDYDSAKYAEILHRICAISSSFPHVSIDSPCAYDSFVWPGRIGTGKRGDSVRLAPALIYACLCSSARDRPNRVVKGTKCACFFVAA